MRYQVLWTKHWFKLSKLLCLLSFFCFIGVSGYNLILLWVNSEGVNEYSEVVDLLFIFLILCAFLIFLSFVISLPLKSMSVVFREEDLIGRNSWFKKMKIPILSITKVYPFTSKNGFNSMIADAGDLGQIYISVYTENLDELLSRLEKKNGAGDV